MRWSIGLGRIAGIDVKIHVTFLLLLAYVGITNRSASGALGGALEAILFYVLLFGCVLLHEFGHALAARRYGIRTRDITLLPIGGVARLESTGETPKQELVIALAGPAVNVVLAILLALLLIGSRALFPAIESLSLGGNSLTYLLIANVFLVAFNLLPAFPMDGGRVLRALLLYKLNRVKATQIASYAGKFMAVLFALVGFLLENPILFLIALFVWMGAGQEAAMVRVQSQLSQVQVGGVMRTEFHVVSPFQSLRELVPILVSGSQRDFPVMLQNQLLGMLFSQDLVRAMEERGSNLLVEEVMKSQFVTADASDSIHEVVRSLQQNDGLLISIPVLREGRLIGLLTPEAIQQAWNRSQNSEPRKPPVLRPR